MLSSYVIHLFLFFVSMAVPINKEELQQAIAKSYEKLKKDLSEIPPELTLVKTLAGHAKDTMMSVSNLVAYLIGWGELVLKWNRKKDCLESVEFPETGYKWNELGKLAQKFYGDYEGDSYSLLLEKLDITVKEIQLLVESKTNAELYEVAWYEKWTRGRMIQFNTSSPYKNASTRIRRWKKAQED